MTLAKTDRPYLSELLGEWRALVAASIGTCTGVGLHYYVVTLFIPGLQREFGWSNSEAGAVSVTVLPLIIALPLAGILVDRIGVRGMVIVSTTLGATMYAALAMMSGALWLYYVMLGGLFVFGVGTTTITWLRVVAQRLDRARGLGLAIALSGMGLMAAFVSPLLNMAIDQAGWRTGYLLLGALLVAGQFAALMIMPRAGPETGKNAATSTAPEVIGYDLAEALRQPIFWVICAALLSINLATPVILNQIKPIVLASGFTSAQAAATLSIFGLGVVFGRFTFGWALDKFPPLLVGAIIAALPAVSFGFVVMLDASSLVAFMVAVAAMGASQGGEADIGAFLCARYFGMRSFSALTGIVSAAGTIGNVLAALMFARLLDLADGHSLLLLAGSVTCAAASLLFLLAIFVRAPAAKGQAV